MKRRLQAALEDKDFFELFNQGGVSFFLRIGGQLLGFFLTLLIAKYFGAEALGEYMLAVVVLRIFTLLAKLGLDTTSIRFSASFAAQNKWKSLLLFFKKVYFILILSSLVSSFVMYFLSNIIADFLNINSEYVRTFSYFVLPMVFFVLHYQSLRGLKKIGIFSFYYRMSQALFTIIIILILLQFSNDPSIPFHAYIISLLFVSILSLLSFWNGLKEKSNNYAEEKTIEHQTLKNILVIALPLMLAQSVQLIMIYTDKLMIGNMMSTADVGIYGVAFKLSMFASVTLMAINSIAAPKFAEIYAEKNMKGLKKIVQKSTKMIFWSTLPLLIIFFLFPTFFLGIFGGEFKIGVNAFIILSVGMLISAFSGSVGNLLQMTGKQLVFMKILIAGAVINVGLNYLLIPESNPFSEFGISGINGAAIASMCSIVFWNLSMVLVVKKQFGFLTFYIPFRKG